MKAISYDRYGSSDVLKCGETAKPAPADNEVLIKIRAASVNPHDWHFMRGEPYPVRIAAGGLRKPKHSRLGADVAGEIEAVGKNITRFKPGNDTGVSLLACNELREPTSVGSYSEGARGRKYCVPLTGSWRRRRRSWRSSLRSTKSMSEVLMTRRSEAA